MASAESVIWAVWDAVAVTCVISAMNVIVISIIISVIIMIIISSSSNNNNNNSVNSIVIHSFMALPSAQDRSEDGNETVSLERSETYPSDKLVL